MNHEPTYSGVTQPGMRNPYLHIEIEAPSGRTREQQTSWLLKFQKWITEEIEFENVVVNKVRNQARS
jgi:hypothetical protein